MTAIGPGARLGPYHVTALIGEAGMGQVYRSWWSRSIPVAAAAIAGAAVTASLLWASAREPARVKRFSHTLPTGLDFRSRSRSVFAVSPDGRRFVLNTAKGLYLRSMDEPEGRLLPGTEEVLNTPFVDQWVERPDGNVRHFSRGLCSPALGG